jgi:hypothetical protein
MTQLNTVCDRHGHSEALPDRELRAHLLAAAVRAAEATLKAHGYPEPEDALEALQVAMEDALDFTGDSRRPHSGDDC